MTLNVLIPAEASWRERATHAQQLAVAAGYLDLRGVLWGMADAIVSPERPLLKGAVYGLGSFAVIGSSAPFLPRRRVPTVRAFLDRHPRLPAACTWTLRGVMVSGLLLGLFDYLSGWSGIHEGIEHQSEAEVRDGVARMRLGATDSLMAGGILLLGWGLGFFAGKRWGVALTVTARIWCYLDDYYFLLRLQSGLER